MIHTEIQDGKGRLFMGYKLELGAWSAVFAVPNALVDRYIKEADGDQLKVMLWLLRHNGRPYAAEDRPHPAACRYRARLLDEKRPHLQR